MSITNIYDTRILLPSLLPLPIPPQRPCSCTLIRSLKVLCKALFTQKRTMELAIFQSLDAKVPVCDIIVLSEVVNLQLTNQIPDAHYPYNTYTSMFDGLMYYNDGTMCMSLIFTVMPSRYILRILIV